jgi:hypothetical protein
MDGLTMLATSIYLRPAQNTRHSVRNQESLSWWQVGTMQRRLRLQLKLPAPVAKAPGWFNRLLSRRAECFALYNLPWVCSTPPYHDDTAGVTPAKSQRISQPSEVHAELFQIYQPCTVPKERRRDSWQRPVQFWMISGATDNKWQSTIH